MECYNGIQHNTCNEHSHNRIQHNTCHAHSNNDHNDDKCGFHSEVLVKSMGENTQGNPIFAGFIASNEDLRESASPFCFSFENTADARIIYEPDSIPSLTIHGNGIVRGIAHYTDIDGVMTRVDETAGKVEELQGQVNYLLSQIHVLQRMLNHGQPFS